MFAADDNSVHGEQQHDELDDDGEGEEDNEKGAEMEVAEDQQADENPEELMNHASAPPLQQPSQATPDADNSIPAGLQGSQNAATRAIDEDSGALLLGCKDSPMKSYNLVCTRCDMPIFPQHRHSKECCIAQCLRH